MVDFDDIFLQMKRNPKNVRFVALCRICDYYFGKTRQGSSSHRVYKTPWQGDPRVNIQNNKTKAYQVKQVVNAIKRLRELGISGTKAGKKL